MKIDKILKTLGEQIVNDIDGLNEEGLRKLIADSEENIYSVRKELDENPQYEAAKQAVQDLSAGYRDVKKFQGAKIQYALLKLREKSSS